MSSFSSNAADLAEIRQVLAKYARGVDRLDKDLLMECYWPDGADDHGAISGTPQEFVDWVVSTITAEFSSTSHVILQSVVDIQGSRAWGESYWQARSSLKSSSEVRLSTGRYEDLFERRDGEWRILVRELVFDWDHVVQVKPFRTRNSPSQDASRVGRMDREDPSYRFRLRHGFSDRE